MTTSRAASPLVFRSNSNSRPMSHSKVISARIVSPLKISIKTSVPEMSPNRVFYKKVNEEDFPVKSARQMRHRNIVGQGGFL